MNLKITRITLLLVFLTGCPSIRYSIISNNSQSSIFISYRIEVNLESRIDNSCYIIDGNLLPKMTNHNFQKFSDGRVWEDIPNLKYDLDTCEIYFILPEGFSAQVYINDFCESDVEKFSKISGKKPRISKVKIEGESGSISVSGWDVSKKFKRVNSDFCIYEYK